MITAQQKRIEEICQKVDNGISKYVRILIEHGIETFESCKGGEGHSFAEPTIRFYGCKSEGFKALNIALVYRIPIWQINRYWSIIDDEPVGPQWEMILNKRRI